MPRVDDNNKAFPRVICTLRGSRIERETEGERERERGWMREGEVPFHTGSRLHYSL